MIKKMVVTITFYVETLISGYGAFVCSVVLTALALATAPSADADTAKWPNVLFIAIDDLRPELGAYGAQHMITPNIDALAKQGLLFKRAYAQVAVCGASRASMMTGILPTKKRFSSFKTRADKEVPNALTLPQVFKQAGYTTLSNGKIFHDPEDGTNTNWSEPAWRARESHWLDAIEPSTMSNPSTKGRGLIFEQADVKDDAYLDGKIAKKSISDLRRLQAANTPFFLAVGFNRPHMPFYVPKKYWDLYQRDKIDLAANQHRPIDAPKSLKGSNEFNQYTHGDFKPGTPQWHAMMRHGYYASVSYVDKLVGDVLDELKRLDLADNTIIVLWGDHGWHLGEHNFWGKHNTMNMALQVPLIVKVPGKQGGAVTSALVESVDIFPTLTSLVGLETPSTVQGASFEDLLTHPQQKFRDFSYGRYANADAVINDKFIYTRYTNGEEMFFDLHNDPGENRNIAPDPIYTDVKASMNKMLKKRMQDAATAKLE